MIRFIYTTIHLSLFSILLSATGYGQTDDQACRNALPFCSDALQELTFANTINQESLGEIGCLNTTPNPAWYFMRVERSGEMIFDIVQWVDSDEDGFFDRGERQLDVDFIAWGPFETSYVNCDILSRECDNNNNGDGRPSECENNADDPLYYIENQDNSNIVDCSYSRNSIETLTIPNAVSGEYYIVLITNFADEAGVIQLQQTNLDAPEAGSTDCDVLEPGLGDDIAICEERVVVLQGRFDNAVSYQWYEFVEAANNFVAIVGETTPVYTAPGSGTYRLEGFDTTGAAVGTDDINVVNVSAAIVQVGYSIAEESFAGTYTITAVPEVVAGDVEDIEYRIDNGDFQFSPVFENVFPGEHQITARHSAGCSEVVSEVIIIMGYPKFFTPNGDGFHDTWRLINIEDQPLAKIYIFDRYGKLLKQLRPGGPGWDGTYNGNPMPSSDYWFRVEFNEPRDPNRRPRVVAGNFSLIR
ncbi:T9SS type B sorting domain-containing protein [Aquimarina sp. W85]|uniref:T9SS type B sorting domain-containing protein n=1 Tax=Aquimarina rhodophyticola TaxID=3342246 RepID=UPI00366F3496